MEEQSKTTELQGVALPEWMRETEDYIPGRDRDGFVTRSIAKLLSVLARARRSYGAGRSRVSITGVLLGIIYLIVLMSLSKNMFFTYVILAGFLLRAALTPGRILKHVMGSALAAFLVSAIIMIPAAVMGSPRTLLTVSGKVFLSVGMLALLADCAPWNEMTGALKALHIPDVFILTFDLTLKYIVILGDICVKLLRSLSLRSVGHNVTKQKSFSGILGVTFLKSQELSQQMYQAMNCRGFEGEYERRLKHRFGLRDIIWTALLAGATVLYIYLERAM